MRPIVKYKNPLSTYERFLQSLLLQVRPAPLASLLKRIFFVSRTTIETPYGCFSIDPISNLGRALSKDGVYESGMQQTLAKYLHTGATFVDLGANEGYFSILAAHLVGSSGRVIAIEPQERLLPLIDKNIRLNDVGWVTVLNIALTDKPKLITIHLAADTNTGASGIYRMAKYRLPTQKIQGYTLTQMLDEQQLSYVDLIKIDIEGAEYEVLMGSQDVFRKGRVRAIALELHPTILESRGQSDEDIKNMLKKYGYNGETNFGNTVWRLPQ